MQLKYGYSVYHFLWISGIKYSKLRLFLGIFGGIRGILGYFFDFFSGILVFHYPPWQTLRSVKQLSQSDDHWMEVYAHYRMWIWFTLLSLKMFLLPFFLPFFRSALLSRFHLAFCGLKMQQNLISLLLFITCALADFCIQFKTKTNSLIDLFNFNLFRVNQRWKSPRPLRSKRRRFLRLAYVVMMTWRCNGLHLPYLGKTLGLHELLVAQSWKTCC